MTVVQVKNDTGAISSQFEMPVETAGRLVRKIKLCMYFYYLVLYNESYCKIIMEHTDKVSLFKGTCRQDFYVYFHTQIVCQVDQH